MQPKVTVVLPTHNRARVLSRAIRSILNQTYSNYNIIVVDDASTDNTSSILKGFESSKVRVEILSHNRGAAGARNVGIRRADGDYIAFHDSDDEWLPTKLEAQMRALANSPSNPVASYTRYRLLTPDEDVQVPDPSMTELDGEIFHRLLKGNVVGTPTLLVRRDVLVDIGGFDEELSSYEDWDLALRIAQYHKFSFVEEPLVNAYYSPDGVNQDTKKSQSLLKILYKFENVYNTRYPDTGSEMFWQIGNSLALDGEMFLARESIKSSLKMRQSTYRMLALWSTYGGAVTYHLFRAIKKLFS